MSKIGVSLENLRRDELVVMAQAAEIAERYEDMCTIVGKLVKNLNVGQDLTFEERNLLSVAYKHVIASRRTAWRTLSAKINDGDVDDIVRTYLKQVRTHSLPSMRFSGAICVVCFANKCLLLFFFFFGSTLQIERELSEVCFDALKLLEGVLFKNDLKRDEARVFYLKMAGDCYRYLLDFSVDQKFDAKAADCYKQALEIAYTHLAPSHSVRIGLALNYSVFLYEIRHDKEAACKFAQSSFDQAISDFDQPDVSHSQDATLLLQILCNNLTSWTAESD
jgi:14-3-3 protein epsilon